MFSCCFLYLLLLFCVELKRSAEYNPNNPIHCTHCSKYICMLQFQFFHAYLLVFFVKMSEKKGGRCALFLFFCNSREFLLRFLCTVKLSCSHGTAISVLSNEEFILPRPHTDFEHKIRLPNNALQKQKLKIAV